MFQVKDNFHHCYHLLWGPFKATDQWTLCGYEKFILLQVYILFVPQ
jgi:hypothetical protein